MVHLGDERRRMAAKSASIGGTELDPSVPCIVGACARERHPLALADHLEAVGVGL
jgi:hypothetical protein